MGEMRGREGITVRKPRSHLAWNIQHGRQTTYLIKVQGENYPLDPSTHVHTCTKLFSKKNFKSHHFFFNFNTNKDNTIHNSSLVKTTESFSLRGFTEYSGDIIGCDQNLET